VGWGGVLGWGGVGSGWGEVRWGGVGWSGGGLGGVSDIMNIY